MALSSSGIADAQWFPKGFKTMKKTAIAIACLCAGISTKAAPSLDVQFSQDQWEYNLILTANDIPQAAADFVYAINGYWVQTTHVDPVIVHTLIDAFFEPAGLFSIGEHVPTFDYTFNGEHFTLTGASFFVSEPTTPRPKAPDGGSTALLAALSLGCVSAHRRLLGLV